MGRVHVDYLSLNTDDAGAQSAAMEEMSDNEDDVVAGLPPSDAQSAASIYVCAACGVHLTKFSSLISREFRGRSGQASLFHHVINTVEAAPEDRMLITGKQYARLFNSWVANALTPRRP